MERKRKNRNRNAIRSEKMLMDAYVSLLMELPAEKITVTAIVDRAGMNRSTFYAHFGCPADVYDVLEQKLVDELLERIDGLNLEGVMTNPKPLLETVSRLVEERHEYVKLMLSTNKAARWMESMKEAIIRKFVSDSENSGLYKDKEILMVNLRFFVGGYIALCRDWLSGKIDRPLCDLTELLSGTISGGLASGASKK